MTKIGLLTQEVWCDYIVCMKYISTIGDLGMHVIKLFFIFIVLHSSACSMMRGPRVNSGQYVPQNLQTRSSSLTGQQLMPQATVNPELLKQVQADTMVQEQPAWTTQEMMPMRAHFGSGAFSATRRNLFRATPVRYLLPGQEKNPLWVQANREVEQYKKICGFPDAVDEALSVFIEQAYNKDLLERINRNPSVLLSNVLQKRKTAVEQELRLLLEHNGFSPEQIPAILSNNRLDISNILQKRKTAVEQELRLLLEHNGFSPEQIPAILSNNRLDISNILQKRKTEVEQETKFLLEHHGLSPEQIPVCFISKEGAAELGLSDALAGVVGSSLLIHEDTLNLSMQGIKAVIEHEIGHLVSRDCAYVSVLELFAAEGKLDRSLIDHYILLFEKRADTHSGIQSRDNVNALRCCATSYARAWKMSEIRRNIPDFFALPEVKKLYEQKKASSTMSALEWLEDFVEGMKQIAHQQHKAQKLSFDDLQKIIKICDQPSHLDDLLAYHLKQEELKATVR